MARYWNDANEALCDSRPCREKGIRAQTFDRARAYCWECWDRSGEMQADADADLRREANG